MTCPYCSAEVEEGMGFCSNCGQMVRPEAVVAVPPDPARAVPPPDAAETEVLPPWPGPAPGGFLPPDPPAPPPTRVVSVTTAPYGPLPPVVTRPPVRRPGGSPLWLLGGAVGLSLFVLCCLAGVLTYIFLGSGPTSPAAATPVVVAATAPPGAQDDPPRIELAAFKQLYDDPSQSLLIIDVRSAETYSAGHIKGAISFPEGDVDQRVGELPRERLVVAYCQ